MSKRRKSRAKPLEEHKKRGPKVKNKVAAESKNTAVRSGAKPGPKPKSAEGGDIIRNLSLPDAARALIAKKEGKPVPPKRVPPTPQTSAWVTSISKIENKSRPPTLLTRKIPKSSKLDSWGEGSGGWLPEVIPQRGGG